MQNTYGLNFNVQSLAIANQFVITLNKACYALGQQLKPFCIFATDKQKESKVVDFAEFQGFFGKTLQEEIFDYRRDVYKSEGIVFDSDIASRKLVFYDYLLSVSACYVELPKYTTKEGLAQQTYDKFICTRNPFIMASWVGNESVATMQAKYSSRIRLSQIDVDHNNIRLVKLMSSNKGNSITVPRSEYNVDKMRIYPLFMFNAFVKGFKPLLENGILEFDYLKDNGTVRTLASTLSSEILMQYYKDNIHVAQMLNGVDVDSTQQGSLHLSSRINRGYIKIPELGSSIYDETGVRALNLPRLLAIRSVDKVDASYIDVDLDACVNTCIYTIEQISREHAEQIPLIYKSILSKDAEVGASTLNLVSEIVSYMRGSDAFLSTTYRRAVHKFMIMNPQWFPDYTGKRKVSGDAPVSSSIGYGIETLDW